MAVMKKLLLILAAALPAWNLVVAAQHKDSDQYYRSAVDTSSIGDDAKAIDLVTMQLKETPNHIDARFLRAKLCFRSGMYDRALGDLSYAVRHYRGKPQVCRSSIYNLAGSVYEKMRKDNAAADSFRKAFRHARLDDRDRAHEYLLNMSRACFNARNIKASDKALRKLLRKNPADYDAMLGLARIMHCRRQYSEGLKWLEKAEQYCSDRSEYYELKMMIFWNLNRFDDCIDAMLNYYALDEDISPETVCGYASKQYSYAIAKAKEKMAGGGDETRWTRMLATLYRYNCDYAKAVEIYNALEAEYGLDAVLLSYRAKCYEEVGEYEKGVKDAGKALELTGNEYYAGLRGDIYRYAGQYEDALDDYRQLLAKNPSMGYAYYALGWTYQLMGDLDTALNIYDEGVSADNTYAYLFLSRGDILTLKGDAKGATQDYEHVLEIDREPADGSCRHFALLALGEEKAALDWLDRMIEDQPNNSGNYYDKCCLFSRMGMKDEAISALRMAMKKGFRSFSHLEHDDDMDLIRDMEEYRKLVNEYKGSHII